jgi:hypothetical protein
MVSLYEKPIDDKSIAMMKGVLARECERRGIKPEGVEGEDLALFIFRSVPA